MQHTALKQIKYNRGQVTDKLSERSDMGLQNACGVVYNNVYINRYGQLQNAPTIRMCSQDSGFVWFMFDTGVDYVIPIGIYQNTLRVWDKLSKSNPLTTIDLGTPYITKTLSNTYTKENVKILQFGSNVLFYGQKTKPFLISITPVTQDWIGYTVNVNENYFDGAFDNLFVRGINIATPSDFTVPTSSYYFVDDDSGVTTKKIITIKRNGAGGSFTQSLVGQVINCPQLSGAVQVREVVDSDTLKAYVLSPLIAANDNSTQININWGNGQSEWLFGYEQAYDKTGGGDINYPDSATYVNQRLVFGGNDEWGNLVAASRIGVINDFDPSDATESDSFSASIATPQNCRIVDFVQSNDELRIATTYGEYAVSLSAFTPTGIIQQGFQLRSQVGAKKDTPICDCGGLTAYVSNDGQSIHITQFSLLQNKYAPISLTSQTENIVNKCVQLVYLRNRANDEGNCLVGLNSDGTMFIVNVDTNAGLNAVTAMDVTSFSKSAKITNIYARGNALWGTLQITTGIPYPYSSHSYLVRFELNNMFNVPFGIDNSAISPYYNTMTIPADIANLINFSDSGEHLFRALYNNNGVFELIKPTGTTQPTDVTKKTIVFDPSIDKSKIISAGFLHQSDWRSVELSLGIATREMNKRIVKLSGVVEPISFHGEGQNINETYKIPEKDIYKFFNLVVGQDAPKLTDEQIDNPVKTIFSEGEDMSWRRGFDNPSRELHYGITMIAPFLIKSTTAVLEYDDVA